ncbi:MAG: Gfo/Idh/MocA family oxidoreductase [Opitutaceae bacterium]|nr:Gfo/Idh/MocA family oxidoreductase [Opitutaceae bacterium]
MPPARLNCALLGLTHPHSGALLQTLTNLPEIGRVSLWEDAPGAGRSPAIPASRKVALVTRDAEAALAACDFAIVCVRNDRAAALAHRVLAAGRHLLAEKPGGLTAAEIAGVKRAADRAGLLASVLYARRAHPLVAAARDILASGALGPLLSLEARFLTTQVRFRDPRSWLFRRRLAGGGILSWLGCHCIDLLQYVPADRITAVSACAARRSGERIDVEDSAALALRFASGAVGTLHVGYTLAFSGGGYLNPAGNDAYFACNGREGRVVWPVLTDPRLRIESPGRRPIRERTFRLRATSSYGGVSGERFLRQYAQALCGRAALPATLADAVSTARVIEAAYASSRTGRTVAVRA